jgi:hypothetical protein
MVTSNYERNPADPRITHNLSLEVDPLGHVVRDATLAYARRVPSEPEQNRTLATCAKLSFAPFIDTAYDYRHGVPTEAVTYELAVAATATILPSQTVDAAMAGATVLPFDGTLAAGTMRTIDHVQHQYWTDDLSAPLPVGSAQARALHRGPTSRRVRSGDSPPGQPSRNSCQSGRSAWISAVRSPSYWP